MPFPMTGSLAVVKKELRAYRLRENFREIKLTTNPEEVWGSDSLSLEKGWAATSAGWLIEPKFFLDGHPDYCIFSKMQYHPQYAMVEAWLFTKDVRGFFDNEKDRELFRFFILPSYLYEIPL
jgi:hypothetical protein